MVSLAIVLLCHFSSALEALAFFQTDMIKLRIFEVVSTSLMAVYSLIHSDYNYLDCHFLWSCFHFLINFAQLLTILYNYLTIELTEAEETLLENDNIFDIFSRHEFALMKPHFEWCTIDVGETIVKFGTKVNYLYLIVEGNVSVLNSHGGVFGFLETHKPNIGPQFIGEISFFSGQPASATVVVAKKVVAIRWKMDTVRKACNMHGHSLVARAFRQLPSLFSKQIAKRLVHDDEKKRAMLAKEKARAEIAQKTIDRIRKQQGVQRAAARKFAKSAGKAPPSILEEERTVAPQLTILGTPICNLDDMELTKVDEEDDGEDDFEEGMPLAPASRPSMLGKMFPTLKSTKDQGRRRDTLRQKTRRSKRTSVYGRGSTVITRGLKRIRRITQHTGLFKSKSLISAQIISPASSSVHPSDEGQSSIVWLSDYTPVCGWLKAIGQEELTSLGHALKEEMRIQQLKLAVLRLLSTGSLNMTGGSQPSSIPLQRPPGVSDDTEYGFFKAIAKSDQEKTKVFDSSPPYSDGMDASAEEDARSRSPESPGNETVAVSY